MTYDAFRVNGGPTLYDSNKTPVTVDVLEIGLIYAIVTLFVSFLLMLPGLSTKSVSSRIKHLRIMYINLTNTLYTRTSFSFATDNYYIV